MPSILICDDHLQMCDTLFYYLKQHTDCEILKTVNSGEACLEFIKHHEIPTILILDIKMPGGMSGYEVARQLKMYYPTIKIIANTMSGNRDVLEGMIRYGVKGYVTKDRCMEELVLSINAILNNKYYFGKQFDLTQTEITNIQNTSLAWLETITPNEFRLANLLNEGYSLVDTAKQLNISASVAKKKRSNLFKKTKTDNIVSLLNKLKKLCIIGGDDEMKAV